MAATAGDGDSGELIARLVLGVITIGTVRLTPVYSLAMLAACSAIGAGWHHHRWSDLAADDLAWSVTETPRPAWVRGVVSEARGLRHQRGGFGFGAGNDEKVTTRFVLDLTSISDGKSWHNASGRADRGRHRRSVTDPGRPGRRGGGSDRHARPAAQSRRVRLSRRFCKPRESACVLTIDDPESFWPDPSANRLGVYALAGSIAGTGSARGCSSSLIRRPRSAGRGVAPGLARRDRSRGQRCVRSNRHDPFARRLRAPVASARRRTLAHISRRRRDLAGRLI